jgi:hypothetical protein
MRDRENLNACEDQRMYRKRGRVVHIIQGCFKDMAATEDWVMQMMDGGTLWGKRECMK